MEQPAELRLKARGATCFTGTKVLAHLLYWYKSTCLPAELGLKARGAMRELVEDVEVSLALHLLHNASLF